MTAKVSAANSIVEQGGCRGEHHPGEGCFFLSFLEASVGYTISRYVGSITFLSLPKRLVVCQGLLFLVYTVVVSHASEPKQVQKKCLREPVSVQ